MSEVFATGIQMGESPRWHDGRFWMCDWAAGEVLAFDAGANRAVVAAREETPEAELLRAECQLLRRLLATPPRTRSAPVQAGDGSID